LNWFKLESESDLNEIIKISFETEKGVAIFKHSTRCSISSVAKMRLESSWPFDDQLPAYYLDLIQHRSVSNEIAAKFNVQHESPQLLVIKNGDCIYHASHMSISGKAIQRLEV